ASSVTGSYGAPTCGGVVQTVLTPIAAEGRILPSPEIAGALLAVDVALSPDGRKAVLVSPAGAHAPAGSLVVSAPLDRLTADQPFGCAGGGDTFGAPIPAAPVDPTVEAPWNPSGDFLT